MRLKFPGRAQFRAVRSATLSLVACFGAALFLLAPTAAHPEENQDTLAKITATRTIRIGHRSDLPPFSYTLPDGSVVGYSIDLCNLVIEAIKTKLQLSDLKVEYVPDTPATRFILVKTGKIDLECASTTNTADRRKQVSFTYPQFLTATQFVSRRADHLDRLQDLAGRSVAAPSGSVAIEQLNAINRTRNLNIGVIPTRSNDDAFEMVISGHAPAFAQDSIILAARVANMPDPSVYALSSDTLGDPEPYGLMYRHGDTAFGTLVNAVLHDIFTSPAMEPLYNKWFLSPMPPNGANLNLPMSPVLRAALRNPTEIAE
jgi:glutamate/aspartate transport system substrate-binding protein